ncbi:hypothetical protein ASG47_18925 [Devosia sp. Leaf420]|uniref:5-oxoprolinase subunit C family protein n=1 Tax=Devosia sp. Leaf420 TaxID=1736374 RepID=UPI0007161986|nr:biotin-dependent carboxyltransferase family protein [Devosia sp. Leaf420]KQT51246.1 hypothetical protein ASG47_18925 [Devosia sp. Leaf420]
MVATITIERAGPLTSIQDAGRFGHLADGISASGPMDIAAFHRAGLLAGSGGQAGIEFSMLGLDLRVDDGTLSAGWDGGHFDIFLNDTPLTWPGQAELRPGDRLRIGPAKAGNYGYLRFGGEIDVPEIMGSRSTSLRAKLGGLDGRALTSGDRLQIFGSGAEPQIMAPLVREDGPIRFIWGLHVEVFPTDLRQKFVTETFRITSMMDRMGVRLKDEAGVFADSQILSLVSDPVICGDIQILGDGTPIVLGRDHQPTGGYPRIGTIISADLDRFFQLRPNASVTFQSVGLDHAQALLRSGTQ